jgi:hypothetical protein
MSTPIHQALQDFAGTVKAKSTQATSGAQEDQLRGPFENLITAAGKALGFQIVPTGETSLADRVGRPDYAIHSAGVLVGYVELKAPGVGANAEHFKGRNKAQFTRFAAIPNLLYTDGNEWALYRGEPRASSITRLNGDILKHGQRAVTAQDAQAVENLLRDFFLWQPMIPTDSKGKINLAKFARLLAPLCRMLRDDVREALKHSDSPLVALANDWRQLLFPEADDEQFADAYAQVATFALLLGRSEGADPLTLDSAEASLSANHSLLSRALEVLTDHTTRAEINVSLNILLRVIGAVPPKLFGGPGDPWLYFYEDFLADYDPELRKATGVYYTPVEVVHAQVRLIDKLLTDRLHKPRGFADPQVVTLDPAVGTGTYLLGVIEHARQRIEQEQGAGAVPGQLTTLAHNLYGFELMVGPYAVAQLRVSRALSDRGAHLPAGGTQIYLTDTLESPNAQPPKLPKFFTPITEQHEKALKVKRDQPVMVCLGNPPYGRHEAVDDTNQARTGGWVRWGDQSPSGARSPAILEMFTKPVSDAGKGGDLKNLYNLYVYFWRWALWKVMEPKLDSGSGFVDFIKNIFLGARDPGPGIVSFITGSSYLDGDAFAGMRQHLRALCDEIWIIDLGGDNRGTDIEANVFNIQTPVAIAVALRADKLNPTSPARVHYTRIRGTRAEKLAALDAMTDFGDLSWESCPTAPQASFRPADTSIYATWPLLTDLMPWQHSGVQAKRTWPIGFDRDGLKARWHALLTGPDRATLFKEASDQKIDVQYPAIKDNQPPDKPISQLPSNAPPPPIERYAYRSLDRQWILADGRLLSRPRPDLWRAHSDRQLYLTSLLTTALGSGPALMACAAIPDLDHFRGSYGAKHVIPLYRDAQATKPNLLPALLTKLTETYGRPVTPEQFAAYVYGVLAHPDFTARFKQELAQRKVRVPLTRDKALFDQASKIGARLLWLHTYAARDPLTDQRQAHIPQGRALCTHSIPVSRAGYPTQFDYDEARGILHVGNGQFAPVAPEVYHFEVSGLKVVQSWLKYRMKLGAGKQSSPLDKIRPEQWTAEMTTELLELLWVLEATVAGYAAQAGLLGKILAQECFTADDFPEPTKAQREPPGPPSRQPGLYDSE